MLHVLNGDSTAQTLKQTSIAGEHLVWKEALIWGPTPAKVSLVDWCRLRSNFLAGPNGIDTQQCFQDLMQQEAALKTLANHDEVVFWFEFDLFCQLNLIYVLGKLQGQTFAETTLSMICIGEFPGIEDFRGLGQLEREQLASLFPARMAVTAEQIELADRAWAACSSSNPREIEVLLAQDTTPLPFLRAALQLHLQRFPSVRNGLGRPEQTALECILRGADSFPELFKAWSALECGYGMGDTQLWDLLVRLAETKRPLLQIRGAKDVSLPASYEEMSQSAFELTEMGHAVLQGRTDFWETLPRECWLSGVCLMPPDPGWRWDDGRQALVG